MNHFVVKLSDILFCSHLCKKSWLVDVVLYILISPIVPEEPSKIAALEFLSLIPHPTPGAGVPDILLHLVEQHKLVCS